MKGEQAGNDLSEYNALNENRRGIWIKEEENKKKQNGNV